MNKQTANKAGPGRPKGSQNKMTVSIKAALSEAFDQMGGVGSLVTWGKANRADFYKLWGRLAPTEITGSGEGGALVIKVVRE